MMKLLGYFFLLFSSVTIAAGPASMATLSRGQLGDSALSDGAAFDQASRLEIMAFAKALLKSEQLSPEQLPVELGIKPEQLDMLSIDIVRQHFWQRLLENYQHANVTCQADCQSVTNLDELRKLAAETRVVPLRAEFHRTYLNEQLRLASLFPKTNSEIRTFSTNEITGDEFADKQFLFTFDDGPSAEQGNTDALMTVLAKRQLHGLFFVLGENLEKRLQQQSSAQIAMLYRGQCVGSHGWQHKSHSKWSNWQDSVLKTERLLRQTVADNYTAVFRPPYGQRKADSSKFFTQYNIRVIFWKIDSQDWSQKVSSDQISDRVLTLMLLWRKGILLFHDTHNKAPIAVETLYTSLENTGIEWLDCRQLFR